MHTLIGTYGTTLLGNRVLSQHADSHRLTIMSRQRLRSSTGTDYLIPRSGTKLGERSFSVTGPTTSSLPETVRAITDKMALKRVLKTHFLISVLIRRPLL